MLLSILYEQRKKYELHKKLVRAVSRAKMLTVMLIASLGLASGIVLPALASAPQETNLLNNQWRVYNINTSVSKLWDISNVKHGNGDVNITLSNLKTGWYTAYLNTNYNVDLSSKSITVGANWTSSLFTNRKSTPNEANFRIYFASAQGNYNSYSYWWSTGSNSIDLNSASPGEYTVSLTDPSQWSDLCGELASNTTSIPAAPNCVGGIDPTMSPHQGFIDAMKNVKVIGVSFGGGQFYANGVANTLRTTANFDLTKFDVTN